MAQRGPGDNVRARGPEVSRGYATRKDVDPAEGVWYELCWLFRIAHTYIHNTEVLRAQMARGGDCMQGVQLLDHGLWDHPAMDPDSCGVIGAFAPIGPWPQSEYSSVCRP